MPVEKLLPVAAVVGEDFVELSAAGEEDDAFVKFVARSEAARILWSDFAKHPATRFLAENFDHQVEMPAHHAHALVEGRFT